MINTQDPEDIRRLQKQVQILNRLRGVNAQDKGLLSRDLSRKSQIPLASFYVSWQEKSDIELLFDHISEKNNNIYSKVQNLKVQSNLKLPICWKDHFKNHEEIFSEQGFARRLIQKAIIKIISRKANCFKSQPRFKKEIDWLT